MTDKARPFLKWAGGKTQLLPELRKYVPQSFGTYHEPFLGAGALFFGLDQSPWSANISDSNDLLIKSYYGVRDKPQATIDLACMFFSSHSERQFYAVRDRPPLTDSYAETAAWMIYINKTCFNGLFRVNRSGKFNVPWGRHVVTPILDTENILKCSAALKHTNINYEDFRCVESRTESGDFVYFDPPYYVPMNDANFTAYTSGGFGPQDHIDLRDLAFRLKQRGVHVLLSSSGCEWIRRLYADDFEIHEVQARRSVNSKGGGRGPVTEFIIR